MPTKRRRGPWSHLVPEYAREAAETYDIIVRSTTKEERDRMPPEAAESFLALHQNALMVWTFDSDRDLSKMRSLPRDAADNVCWPERTVTP